MRSLTLLLAGILLTVAVSAQFPSEAMYREAHETRWKEIYKQKLECITQVKKINKKDKETQKKFEQMVELSYKKFAESKFIKKLENEYCKEIKSKTCLKQSKKRPVAKEAFMTQASLKMFRQTLEPFIDADVQSCKQMTELMKKDFEVKKYKGFCDNVEKDDWKLECEQIQKGKVVISSKKKDLPSKEVWMAENLALTYMITKQKKECNEQVAELLLQMTELQLETYNQRLEKTAPYWIKISKQMQWTADQKKAEQEYCKSIADKKQKGSCMDFANAVQTTNVSYMTVIGYKQMKALYEFQNLLSASSCLNILPKYQSQMLTLGYKNYCNDIQMPSWSNECKKLQGTQLGVDGLYVRGGVDVPWGLIVICATAFFILGCCTWCCYYCCKKKQIFMWNRLR